MKTKEQYFKDIKEEAKKRSEERRLKWAKEIAEEIKGWSIKKLEDEYIKVRLSKISYGGFTPSGTIWKHIHDECRFCGLEYTQGKHDDCCDDCFEENKGKTLEELENE